MNNHMINPYNFKLKTYKILWSFGNFITIQLGINLLEWLNVCQTAKTQIKGISSQDIQLEYFRKKSHTPINSNTIKFQEFEELDSRDKIIKFYLHYREQIKINEGLLKHMNLPILSQEPLIIEELSTTKPRYNVIQKELQQKEKDEL